MSKEELKTLKDFEFKARSWADAMANAGRKYTIEVSDLKQEAIKWVKLLLKITKTKIIKMPVIKLTKKGIDVRNGHFDGQCMGANHQPTNEFYSTLILCKMYDLTKEDLK